MLRPFLCFTRALWVTIYVIYWRQGETCLRKLSWYFTIPVEKYLTHHRILSSTLLYYIKKVHGRSWNSEIHKTHLYWQYSVNSWKLFLITPFSIHTFSVRSNAYLLHHSSLLSTRLTLWCSSIWIDYEAYSRFSSRGDIMSPLNPLTISCRASPLHLPTWL